LAKASRKTKSKHGLPKHGEPRDTISALVGLEQSRRYAVALAKMLTFSIEEARVHLLIPQKVAIYEQQ